MRGILMRRLPVTKCFLMASTMLLSLTGLAYAQNQTQVTDLPSSMKFLKGNPVSLSQAELYYGTSVTSTEGLCRDYSNNSLICNSGKQVRHPKLKELAKALDYNPDLIYDYVYNTIDTEFLFGSHKGALGTMIDKSGTVFDQNRLLFELLQESGQSKPSLGLTAQYLYGQITLNAAGFYDWTGIKKAKSACEYLSTGGFPFSINGSSASCNLAGDVVTITMPHLIIKATHGGKTYYFDPAYKSYTHKAGIDLKAVMGITSNQVNTIAQSGMEQGTDVASGLSYISKLNQTNIDTKLSEWSAKILTRLQQSDMNGKDVTDVIGGSIIRPVVKPQSGWPTAKPTYFSEKVTWSSIPDQYRARFSFYSEAPEPYWNQATQKIENKLSIAFKGDFFSDEVYGRRIELGSLTSTPLIPGNGAPVDTSVAWRSKVVWLDKAVLTLGPKSTQDDTHVALKMAVNHPFAENDGQYADASTVRMVDFIEPISLVHGWGKSSTNMLKHITDAASYDIHTDMVYRSKVTEGTEDFTSEYVDGDHLRAQIGASWLSQFNNAVEMHARLAGGKAQTLHNFGVISSESAKLYPNLSMEYNKAIVSQYKEPDKIEYIDRIDVYKKDGSWLGLSYIYEITLGMAYEFMAPGSSNPQHWGYNLLNKVTTADINSSIGLIIENGNELARQSGINAIALSGAALEGSVTEELSDQPDTVSTAERFRWANNPELSETRTSTPRRFYDVPNATNPDLIPLIFDGINGSHIASANIIAVNDATRLRFINKNREALSNYLRAGYEITALNDSGAGPGHLHGGSFVVNAVNNNNFRYPSYQRGGAFVARKYDSIGGLIEVANIITRYSGEYKGGGGTLKSVALEFSDKQAELLKSKFVDRTNVLGVDLGNGSVSYTTPVLNSIGQGEFPYRLEKSFSAGSGTLKKNNPLLFENLQFSLDPLFKPSLVGSADLSSSALEGMGQSRVEPMASTLAAFVAMQNIWETEKGAKQDVAGQLTAAWWLDTQRSNVLTVHMGASAEQYIHTQNGQYVPASGGGGSASVTGKKIAVRPLIAQPNSVQKESENRSWDYKGVVISVKGAEGDVRRFQHWGAFHLR